MCISGGTSEFIDSASARAKDDGMTLSAWVIRLMENELHGYEYMLLEVGEGGVDYVTKLHTHINTGWAILHVSKQGVIIMRRSNK